MTDQDFPRPAIGAREYLQDAFEPSDRIAVLVRNPQRGETRQRITTAATIAEPGFQQWLHFQNHRNGSDIYVGMNPLKPTARTRTKQDIFRIRHLYVDLDHDGAASLALIQQSQLVPGPNYVLSTSPGKFQVVWTVEDIAQDQAEVLLRAMARKFGGDPAATDSTRVLRLPGFANKKYLEEFIVQAERHSQHVHHLADFRLQVEQLDSPYPPVSRNLARTASSEPRPRSQSEYDWAFAKRALARGTDPEEVIRRIAKYREGDKHDALDYARRTVRKAQAELPGRIPERRGEDDPTRANEIEFDP
jgi:hypothetical protein